MRVSISICTLLYCALAASASAQLSPFSGGPHAASAKSGENAEGVVPLLGQSSGQRLGSGMAAGVGEGTKRATQDKGLCIDLLAPAFGATVTLPISFSWSDICGLSGYQLWISTTDQFLQGSTWAFNASASGIVLGQVEWNEVVSNIGAASTYFWTVYMPEFGFTDGSFGSIQVSLPQCTLGLGAPAANTDVAFPVTFSWSATDCVATDLIIADGNGGSDIFVSIPVTGTSLTLTDSEMLANIRPLRRVETYYWAVRNTLTQTISELRPFRATALCSAILDAPASGAQVKPPARFTWRISGQCTQQFVYFYGGDPAPTFVLTLPVSGNEYVLSPEVSEFVQLFYSPPYFWGVSQQAEINGERGVVSTSGPARPLDLLEVTECISTPIAPAADATLALPATFSWNFQGDCPDPQEVILAASPTPTEVVSSRVFGVHGPNGEATATVALADLAALPRQDVYYWAVGYSLAEFGTTIATSEFRPFRVSNQACGLSLSAPASGASVSFPATFSWSQLGGCNVTTLAFSKNANGSQPQTVPATSSPATVSASQWAAVSTALGLSAGQAVYWSAGNGTSPLTDPQPFFVSEPPSARSKITGLVTSGDSNTPLAGVAVDFARTVDGVSIGRVSTDSAGMYSFEAPNTITLLTVRFESKNYQPLEFANTAAPATVNARLFKTKPDAPRNVEAKAGGGQNELRWEPSENPEVAGYNIYRASGTLTFTKTNTALVELPQFDDTETSNLKNYEYYVTAVTGGAEPLESDSSSIAKVQANVIGVSVPDVSGKGNGFVRVPVVVDNAAGIRPKGTQISVRVPVNLLRRDYNQNGFEKGIKVEGTGVGAAFSFSEKDDDPGLVTVTSTSDTLVPAGNGHIVDIALATAPAAAQSCGTVKLESITFVDKFSLNIAALIARKEAQLCLEGDCLQGDLTGDGTVNIGDAVRALAISVDNFTADACAYKAGDLNGDREIDSGDSVTIQRIIQGKSANPQTDAKLLPKAGEAIRVEVQSVEVNPGATEVTVPVFIENAGAMAGADLNFSFQKDDAVLDLQQISKGAIAAGFSEDNNVSRQGSGAISYSQATAVASQGRTTLAVLEFKLNKDIAPGTRLPVRIAEADLKGIAGDDLSWRAAVETVSGEIVVKANTLITPQLLVQVNDGQTNEPVTGAVVSVGPLASQRAKEDIAGLYGWPALTPGNYNVSVEATGYTKTTTPVALSNSLSVPVKMQRAVTAGPWTLAITNGTRNPSLATYADGTVVTITAATPPIGQVFDRWNGDTANVANVNASPTTVIMRANTTLTAAFRDATPGLPFLTGIDPNSGSTDGGNTVTLTGTNLGNAISVSFGGGNAPFTQISNTQVSVTAPAHAAGVVTVNITTPGGTSNNLSYTYLANGISVSPDLREVGAAAATVEFQVTATAGKNWRVSENINWLTITQPEGGNGSGSGAIRIACNANETGATREAILTLSAPGSSPASQTFRVRQAGIASGGPVLAAIVPGSGPAAGGTTVTLSGNNLAGATGVDFGGSPATAVTVVNANSLTCISPAHAAGAVQVTVNTTSGASNPLTFTYESDGGGGSTGGCSCGGNKSLSFEDALADLLLGLMVATALFISNRVWSRK